MARGFRGPAAVVPEPSPDKTGSAVQDAFAPPAAPARSVPLTDLLLIAVLTPAQAVLVTADLLEAAAALDGPSKHVNAVVTAQGTLDVADRGTRDGRALVPELLDDILRSARRLPAHPRPHQLWLLQRLEEQVALTGPPAERAAALRQALTDVLGADAPTQTRGELATVVAAFGGIAVPRHAPANGETATSTLASPSWSVRPHGNPSRQYGVARRRLRPRWVLVGLVVLAVLLGGGYVVLRDQGSGLAGLLPGHSHPATAHGNPPPRAHPKHHRGHPARRHHGGVPALASLSAGRVHGVTLQNAGGCRPGTRCKVQVTVHLAPAGVSQPIGWRVGVVEGCTKHVVWSPTTTVTAQPGWSRVFASTAVQVPKGHALSLVALTATPAHAQSRPLPVAGAAPHC